MEETGVNQTLLKRIADHFRSLFRDPENGQLLGVCAGLANAFRLNPLAVRIVAVALLVSVPMVTAAAYVILAVMLPDKGRRNTGAFRSRRYTGLREDDLGVSR
jgi:phage shock protein PspC (stress-responsive transcriptional regulator)